MRFCFRISSFRSPHICSQHRIQFTLLVRTCTVHLTVRIESFSTLAGARLEPEAHRLATPHQTDPWLSLPVQGTPLLPAVSCFYFRRYTRRRDTVVHLVCLNYGAFWLRTPPTKRVFKRPPSLPSRCRLLSVHFFCLGDTLCGIFTGRISRCALAALRYRTRWSVQKTSGYKKDILYSRRAREARSFWSRANRVQVVATYISPIDRCCRATLHEMKPDLVPERSVYSYCYSGSR